MRQRKAPYNKQGKKRIINILRERDTNKRDTTRFRSSYQTFDNERPLLGKDKAFYPKVKVAGDKT
jgi:hypothetical protein